MASETELEDGEQRNEYSRDSIQTDEQPRSLAEQSQNTDNGSLSSRQGLLSTERGSSLFSTLDDLDHGFVTVEGKKYDLSAEEKDYQAVSRRRGDSSAATFC